MCPEDTGNIHLIDLHFLKKAPPTLNKDLYLGAQTVYTLNSTKCCYIHTSVHHKTPYIERVNHINNLTCNRL